jgi:hypothetical protein
VVRSRPRDAGIIGLAEGTMGLGVESLAQQFSFDVCVPVVLYLVVRPPGQSPRNKRPLVADEGVEFDDELVFFFREASTLQIRTQVVYPSEPAALSASQQPCGLGKRTPAPLAVGSNVSDEAVIFLFSPGPFVSVSLLTARRSPHLFTEKKE